jgi:Gpi18-like mannosyltransferase
MSAWEDRLKAFVQKNILWMAFAAVFVFGAFMRYTLSSYVVPDMMADFIPWMQALQSGGIKNLLSLYPAFPYSAMHVYVWALAAGIFPHAEALSLLKGVVIFFDAAQIAVGCLLVWGLLPKARKQTGTFTAFTLLWLHPILLLSAAVWGQTDVIYLGFVLLSLLLLFKRKPALMMLSFGLALAFKLQAIFLLPALMILYFCYEKKFSILWFLLIPAVWLAVRIPMQWIGGGTVSAADFLTAQTGSYAQATMNAPNLHALLGEAVKSPLLVMVKWERYSIFLTCTVLLAMATWILLKKIRLDSQAALLLGAWSVLVCVFFLPHMHERYGIAGEILLLLWAVVLWKPRGFLYALLSMLPVASAYCEYVLDREMFSLQLGGALNLILIVALTWEMVRQGKERLHGG